MSNSLKDAFLNLGSALGHCQENSRSIVDALKRGCSDLAENSEGGGGGSSQDYSTTEHVVGKWVDGTSDVYERTYVLNNIAFAEQSVDIDTDFPTNNTLISAEGFVLAPGGSAGTSLCGIPGIDNWEVGIHLARPNLVLYAGKQASISTLTGGTLYVTIRYIKTV